MKNIKKIFSIMLVSVISCAPMHQMPVIPSLEYSRNLKTQLGDRIHGEQISTKGLVVQDQSSARAHMHFVNNEIANDELVTNAPQPQFEVYESTMRQRRDYQGSLSVGDPGVTASLWRETRSVNDIFRDQRAWQPMDLITILILEQSEGTKEADTEVISQSIVEAAIEQFFTIDDDLVESNPGKVDPSALVSASTQNNFRGEGDTRRRGLLRGTISAMVAEVLPSGILRIEGQKIISVNNEEQVMVISGLVRTRDITANNEVDSAKVANMRIDYYGNGVVSEAQFGGWMSRLMRYLWPF